MAHLKLLKPSSEAEKTTRTTLDVFEVTPDIVNSWKSPPFQRPLKINALVVDISQDIANNGGIIPGVLTLGVLGQDRYLIDGQHRREAFLMSNCPIGYVDVRVGHFKDMAELAEEFFRLNSRIVQMKPDDYLRALEPSNPALARLRKACPIVGYGTLRQSDKAPIISASATLRSWSSSAKDIPGGGGHSAIDCARELTQDEAEHLIAFLDLALAGWGRDPEYSRLWGSLNTTLCMWLYRRIVMTQHSVKSALITKAQFQKCLTALSADAGYLDWLRNRNLGEKNRSPGYKRIKDIFIARLAEDLGTKPKLPAPTWGGG